MGIVVDDLAALFATPEITSPVTLGGASTRGIVDSAGQFVPLGAAQMQVVGTMLYIQKDKLAGLEEGATLQVGEVGATDMVGAKTFKAGPVQPLHDGLILAVQLGGGR